MGILGNSALKRIESSKLLLSAYHLYQSVTGRTNVSSVNHEKRIIFVHNPKVAGTSLRDLLGLKGDISHLTPGLLVNKKLWEKYFVIVAVREPVERFISSYNYHTSERYSGFYLRKFPDIKAWSVEEYFEIFSQEPFGIISQVNYLFHPLSRKKADFIIRYETLDQDVARLLTKLNIHRKGLPLLNDSRSRINRSKFVSNKKLMNKLIGFYSEDYRELGYPVPIIQ